MPKIPLAISLATTIYCGTVAFQSIAANYPERPVRFIVPSAAGGAPDVAARLMAAEFTRQMDKPFIVDNRPGASGSLGTELLVRAVPDGYTIGSGIFSTMVTNRSMLPNLAYDFDRDIQPVGRWGLTPNMLAVANSLPVKSVAELIDYARKNPGKLIFASNGNGTSMHLSGELFKRMTNTQMLHVPYKGVTQSITEMITGQVHLIFDNALSIGAHARTGRVRGLAVTTMTRLPAYPDLPTVAESGLPQFEIVTFGGVLAPAGTPKIIVNQLNAQINRAVAASAFRDKYSDLGSIPLGGTPEEFAAFIKKEAAKWTAVIKDANIKAD